MSGGNRWISGRGKKSDHSRQKRLFNPTKAGLRMRAPRVITVQQLAEKKTIPRELYPIMRIRPEISDIRRASSAGIIKITAPSLKPTDLGEGRGENIFHSLVHCDCLLSFQDPESYVGPLVMWQEMVIAVTPVQSIHHGVASYSSPGSSILSLGTEPE
jgi:hypothetical protein